MKRFCRLVLLALIMLALSLPAMPQQKVAPPPKPADEGPSLAVTMQFIQAKLNDLGKVNYVAYWHDSVQNTDGTKQFSLAVSNVVANPAACRIAYHSKFETNGTTMSETDRSFNLREVQDLVVRTGEQHEKMVNTDNGHPSIDSKVDPPIFVLVVRQPGKTFYAFMFFDEQLANRVAKALVHAVELCGGGNKDPF